MRGVPVIVTNHETAELVRESATAFVATKISFINELSRLCEHVNADAVSLSLALGLDKKIALAACNREPAWGDCSPNLIWSRWPNWRAARESRSKF